MYFYQHISLCKQIQRTSFQRTKKAGFGKVLKPNLIKIFKLRNLYIQAVYAKDTTYFWISLNFVEYSSHFC